MSKARPDRPETPLTRLYDLAEQLATEIGDKTPNWCRIARDATELARLARECDQKPQQ